MLTSLSLGLALVAAAALVTRQKQAEPARVPVKNEEEKSEKRDE